MPGSYRVMRAARTHSQTHAHTRTRQNTHTHARTHERTNARTRTRTRTSTHTHTHTHTHKHKHKHKHAQTQTRRDTHVAKRHRGDSNPCGQSPMDFGSISLTARTQCRYASSHVIRETKKKNLSIALPGRLELPTLRLTASRSNQLSYGSMAIRFFCNAICKF